MKNSVYAISIALILGVPSCQNETVDVNAEKEAILKVIQNESEFARDGEFEDFVDLYIHDEYNTRIIHRLDSLTVVHGWDNIHKEMSYIQEREKIENHPVSVTKANPIIKISGNSAWVVCDNIWQGVYEGEEYYSESVQITILEKVEGEWKISMSAWMY